MSRLTSNPQSTPIEVFQHNWFREKYLNAGVTIDRGMASTVLPSGGPGIDHNLGHVLLLVAPDLVHPRRILDRDAMRNDVRRI